MIYNNLNEIFAAIEKTRGKLIKRLTELSVKEADFRPVPDQWTTAEIAEHLVNLETGVINFSTRLLEKAEADGVSANLNGQFAEPVSFAEIAQKATGAKFQAPTMMQPSRKLSIAESLPLLAANRAALLALRPRLEAVNLSDYKYPHPAFGPLNVYYWLAIIGIHEARHLQQIENLLQTFNETSNS